MSESESGILALKPLALKRKAVAHSDKVRYRVYVTHDEFIAVIAENALMAMKLSGVAVPIRIVRDLPLAQNSVARERLTPHHMQSTVFLRPDSVSTADTAFQPIHIETDSESRPFEALALSGLHSKRQSFASTIDVAVMLKALSAEQIPAEPAVIQRDASTSIKPRPPAAIEPVQAEVKPEIFAEAIPPVVEEKGLTQEEIERLLNEPRA